MKLTDLGQDFELWKIDFHSVKDETRRFLEHLTDKNKETKLWKHQLEAVLRVIYSYEVLGKNNLLLNIVTGGGKTAIIGACIAWLKMCQKLDKFLILVPNLIVRDRLQRDFLVTNGEKSVFQKFDLFPKEFKHLENELNAHIMEGGASPQGILDSGVILGNIHQLYEANTSGKRNLDWFLNKVGNFAIFNDEAHNTPAEEYTKVLRMLTHKTIFRLDTTATPERADAKPLDSEMIMEYGIAQALDDGIIKSVVVYQPDAKIVELTYTNKITGEKKKVTELDKEFKEAEANVKPFQWIMDSEPMKKQISIALKRFDEQKRRSKERYKPILFIVTMGIEEGKRVRDVFNKDFNLGRDKVLLVTEDTADEQVGYKPNGELITAREAATNLGKLGSSFEVVISVMMLREGWDVPEVSVILLLRKFCSQVYGQQVIGRGLRKIIRNIDEREILAVVDHPKLQHDWLWRKVGASGVRTVDTEDVLGDEDIPITPKIQRLTRPENLIEIPSPEYETKIDFDAILKKIPKKEISKNWEQILDSVKYDKDKWVISKTRIEQMIKLYVDKERRMEILSGEDIDFKDEEEKKKLSKEELEDLFKKQIVEMASNLLLEYGFGGLKKGELYNVIIDHIKLKLFNGKTLSETNKEEIETVLENLEEIRKNFTQPIVEGILGGKKNAN
ncbi:MAG: DEAD/DEAH box helicase family protein [Elusimicrobia bacterium]|nr:DEAD/DEAH box helicase family protein [Elusimicrobiota bacterium]